MTDKNYFSENHQNQYRSDNDPYVNTQEHQEQKNTDMESRSEHDDVFENPYASHNDSTSQNTSYQNKNVNEPQQQAYDTPYRFLFPEETPSYTGADTPQSGSIHGQYMQNSGSTHSYDKNMTDTQAYSQNNVPFNEIPTENNHKNKAKKEKKGLSRSAACVLVAVCILLSGICGAGGALLVSSVEKSNNSGSLVINKVEKENGNQSTDNSSTNLSFTQISDKAADSVVEITTESVVTGSFMQQYISSGAGSGVIISSDGYIISNNHVIDGATSIKVTLRNGESYDATLVGTDKTLDVSLLKIDASNLTTAVFGDSEELKVGDPAIAIGNPLGQLGGTVTTGIISALDRDIDIDGVTMNLLQTNAAINPGNSGGGLFNGHGELIGLVVAKSSGEDVEGLGFAIPINDVTEILDDLKEYGYVRGRIYIGMSLVDIPNEQTAAMYGLKTPGVYVNAVDAGSAAAAADIQAADRIISVDGKKVSSTDEIEDILDEHKVGDSVKFEIERTSRLGKTTTGTVTVVLQEYIPSLTDRVQSNSNSGTNDYSDILDDIFGGIFG